MMNNVKHLSVVAVKMILLIPSEHGQDSSEYVFRGEILESVQNEKRYNPQFNQQIDPQNREAIFILSNYQRFAH